VQLPAAALCSPGTHTDFQHVTLLPEAKLLVEALVQQEG